MSSNSGPALSFGYDASGNRVTKLVHTSNWMSVYVRDASGNIMSVYVGKINDNAGNESYGVVKQTEVSLYGSSRLG